MDKTEKTVEKRSFRNEIVLALIFTLVAVLMSFFNVESWISLTILEVGLLSLFLNDINRLLDVIIAVLWSGLYAFYCYTNGFAVNGVLVSLFYLFIQLKEAFKKPETKEIVGAQNKLKTHETIALVIVAICLAVGSYFLARIWTGEVLVIFDTLSAVMLCVSLYLMLKRTPEYFVIRLIAMIGVASLWATRALLYGLQTGSLHIVLMFVAFIIYDNIRLNTWTKNHANVEEKTKSILESEEYLNAQKKYNQENPIGLPGKSIGVDKDSKRK
ncbi:MAG: hypothetical protein IJS68_03985 [Clostridia bacterium]|nr:hypothetical protein [Clostridia bacterium]